MVLTVNSDYFLRSINQLIFVMVKCGVLFEVRTEFLKSHLDELRLQKVKKKLSCIENSGRHVNIAHIARAL
jgi:hypothetical protein